MTSDRDDRRQSSPAGFGPEDEEIRGIAGEEEEGLEEFDESDEEEEDEGDEVL